MKRFKKRTLALCLASALTVIGAFGAENYSNTLMAVKINVGSGGYVNMTTFTEKPYSGQIKTAQLDENTYVLTLNDTNSNATTPSIENYENIESINISTYPYTTESDGCTRIVVKTVGEPKLVATNALFIEDSKFDPEYEVEDSWRHSSTEDNDTEESHSNYKTNTQEDDSDSTSDVSKSFVLPDYSKVNQSNGTFGHNMLLLGISVILLAIGLVFIFSRDKMAGVVGEGDDFDVNDKKSKKQSKTKKIKSTINKLDKTYNYNASDIRNNQFEYTQPEPTAPEPEETAEENVIVDLDLLYQEVQKTPSLDTDVNESETTEENNGDDDLADLLNSFMTDPMEESTEEQEEEPFDEELYNAIISNTNLKFSDADIKKINKLIQMELSEETITEYNRYLSTPHKKPMTKQQILEDLLSTYSIKQNIDFTQEDVDVIKKLMDVELGPDFAKDFATNPARTKKVEKEIAEQSGHKAHRTSEIITLNVKNMLPNLSEELKKYGSKNIKSEAKPAVIYYSEGYEYEKLHVSNELSNIAENMKKDKTQNEHKPSYQAPIVDSGYEVSTLAIKDSLPNLADVWANPQKYEEKKDTKPKADESALLKSIANVTFKPFYEDVENELNQFDNFEIINPYKYEYNNQNINYTEPEIQEQKTGTRQDDNAGELLKLIEEQQAAREQKRQLAEDNAPLKKELTPAVKEEKKAEQPSGVYNYNGKTYTIIKTIKCTQNGICRFIQSGNEFAVIGNLNGNEYVLKEYKDLKNSTMQIRLNDKSDKTKFLVKVDNHKFLISITKDNMEHVMDLC